MIKNKIFRDYWIVFILILVQRILPGKAQRHEYRTDSQVTILDTKNSKWSGWLTNRDKYSGWRVQNRAGRGEPVFGVCEVEEEATDNWLVSPLLLRDQALSLHVEITFTLRGCTDYPDPNRLRHCKETFDLYVHETEANERALVPTDFTTKLFQKKVTIAPDKKWIKERDPLHSILNTQTKKFSVSKVGVYVALRDTGACGTLDTIRIFYLVCPPVKMNFFQFPRTPTARHNDIKPVDGQCVPGAVRITNTTFTRLCKSDGVWHVGYHTDENACQCKPGHTPAENSSACKPCRPSQYKKLSGSKPCLPCPKLSHSGFEGASNCPCKPGHYRNSVKDTSNDPCTSPPSEPTNLHVFKKNHNSVTLTWNPPTIRGGRSDLEYHVLCAECPTEDIRFRPAQTVIANNITIQNLRPNTLYQFHVYARNGVSAIAGSRWKYRDIVTTKTEQGPDNKIIVIRIDRVSPHSVRVIWDNPASIEMSSYEVKVYPKGQLSLFTIYPTDLPDLRISHLQTSVDYILQVRGKTRFGWGQFSDAMVIRRYINSLDEISLGDSREFNDHNTLKRATSIIVITCVTAIVCVGLAVIAVIFLSRRGFWTRYIRTKTIPEKNISCSNPRPYCNMAMQLYQPGSSVARTYIDPYTYEDHTLAVREFTKEIERSSITIEMVIGEGEFGEVCKGRLHLPAGADQIVAVKTLKSDALQKNKIDFLAEASIMGQFDHANVIGLRGVVTRTSPIWIVTEFMENGSLDSFLRSKAGKFTTLELTQMLRGIASGMHYLSDIHFVHRDLAARNILINAKLVCKVADFGLSRELELDCSAAYTTMGGKVPVRWTAPEALMYRKYTTSSDIWAFGVVMWEVLSHGQRPYWTWSNQRVIQQVVEGSYRLPPPTGCPEGLARLMADCWHRERCQRPKFGQIVQLLDRALRNPDSLSGKMQIVCDDEYTTITRPLIDLNNLTQSDTITEWLSTVKLDQYAPVFIANHITNLDYVTRLGQQDLLNLGVTSSSHRKRLLSSIESIRRRLGHMTGNCEFNEDGSMCTEKLLNGDPIV